MISELNLRFMIAHYFRALCICEELEYTIINHLCTIVESPPKANKYPKKSSFLILLFEELWGQVPYAFMRHT